MTKKKKNEGIDADIALHFFNIILFYLLLFQSYDLTQLNVQ